jgi:hypothetical protein
MRSVAMAVLGSLALLQPAHARPPKVIKVVEVDGHKFKVRWRGVEALVTALAVFTNSDADFYQREKRAAELATGCKVTATFPREAQLDVTLDCATAQLRKQ